MLVNGSCIVGEYQRLLRNPGILREECQADETLRKRNAPSVIIDEVQKIPALLDEVHWLIENRGIRFVLCGSSARKVKRGQANLLGGVPSATNCTRWYTPRSPTFRYPTP